MNAAVELHDTELASVDTIGDEVRIVLRPSYVHQSDGVPGVDRGTVWVQDIDIVVGQAVATGDLDRLPTELGGGYLLIDDKRFNNCIPFPLSAAGHVIMRLELMWGGIVEVCGTGVAAKPVADPKYVEDFSG
jgi:hypothetical protein